MSRSRKKIACKKEPGVKKKQVVANRRFRRAAKIAVHTECEVLPLQDEITNQYDVCDWKFLAGKSDDYYERFKRK